jgi:hypothetical protein
VRSSSAEIFGFASDLADDLRAAMERRPPAKKEIV